MYNPFQTLETRLSNIEALLLDLKHSTQTPFTNQPDRPLTVQEAAEFLTLAVPTLYGMVSRSEIPYSKKGHRLRFSKQELTEWVESGRKKTISEIEAEAVSNLGKKRRR